MIKVELSLSQLAAECGMARETVSRALDLAAVKPCGERRGYPVYRLKACLRALAAYLRPEGEGPDGLPPWTGHCLG